MKPRSDNWAQVPNLVTLLLYIYSLWGFVVAQPIYSDLFNDGGFFRWYQNTASDIAIALLVLSFLLPGLIILFLWLLSRLSSAFTVKLCNILITILLGGFFLLCLRGLPNMPYLLKSLIALICGAWLTRVLWHNKEREFLLYFFAAGAFMFPFWFWLVCPITTPFQPHYQIRLLSNSSNTESLSPIVMIIFDELPLTSLLDKHGQIDPVHYPNFSALARNATWYPNAVTVHSITRGAVPAILTGKYPTAWLNWSSLLSGHYEYTCTNPLPTSRDFPNTLFNLLEKSYALQVYESRIYLCNAASCVKHRLAQPTRHRLKRMFSKITEEYFFRILFNSEDLYKFSSSFNEAGEEIDQKAELDDSPVSHDYDLNLFHQLLQAIHKPERWEKKPTFYFIHPILPHSPWEYYPSGKRYSFWNLINPATDVLCQISPSLLYCKNSAFPAPLYKRHLLQVEYVDNLLGQVISKLKATQLYDRSLIVVVADHGISFKAYEPRRKISRENYAAIMSIPLLIKKPGQVIGKVDNQQAETVDIVPTIAGLLHLPLAWHTDGRDLFIPLQTDRTSHSICSPNIKLHFSLEKIEDEKRKELQEKEILFPE
jgi:hypothetical protein